MDSRLRGNDGFGSLVMPAKAGIQAMPSLVILVSEESWGGALCPALLLRG